MTALREDRAKFDARLPPHRQPERHHCRRRDRTRRDKSRRWSRNPDCSRTMRRLRTQLHGLRGAANLRPRLLAESERYLPDLITALDGRLVRSACRPTTDRHSHDRLPERLRTALSRRRSASSAKAPANTTSISARPSTARACPSFMRRISTTTALSLRSIRSSRPMRPSAKTGERFGDFTIRAGFVAKTGNGADFHANTGAKQPSGGGMTETRKPSEGAAGPHGAAGAAAGVSGARGQACCWPAERRRRRGRRS